VGDVAWFAWLGCGEVELRAGGGNGGAQAAATRWRLCALGGAEGARAAQRRRHGRARMAYCGGEGLQWRRTVAVRWNGGGASESGAGAERRRREE